MTDEVKHALETEKVIDITTIGRKSGQPRRIEIWFHNIDGELYITGSPGKRSWYANLLAHPEFTFHLKQSVQADLKATATAITDRAEKAKTLEQLFDAFRGIGMDPKLEDWLDNSPLVRVELLDD